MKFKQLKEKLLNEGADVVPLVNDRLNLLRRSEGLDTEVNYECSYDSTLYLGTFYGVKGSDDIPDETTETIFNMLNSYKKENKHEPKHIKYYDE